MRSLPMVLLAASVLPAQDLNQIRDQLRRDVQSTRYSTFIAAFAALTSEAEVSGGRLRVDGDVETALSVLTVPWRREVALHDDWPLLRLEADLGYSTARIDVPDIYGGADPNIATRVTSEYQAFGAFFGAGPTLPAGPLRVTPMLVTGLAYVDNDTDFAGPGAAVTQSLTERILFNWDATYLLYGGALRVELPETSLGDVKLRPLLRYDLRRTEDLDVDDASQGDAGTDQWLVARLELEGPTGLELQQRPLRWLGTLAYKRFFGDAEDVLGFADYFEIGGGLAWDCRELVPGLSQIGLRGAWFVGEDLRGFTIGGLFRF